MNKCVKYRHNGWAYLDGLLLLKDTIRLYFTAEVRSRPEIQRMDAYYRIEVTEAWWKSKDVLSGNEKGR
jgi:hypothetical protein